MCSDEYLDNDLHVAVRLGDKDAAKEALVNGCNPNDIGLFEWNSLHEAAVNGDRDILELLLDNGGNPNKKDKLNSNTPLHYACIEGHESCMEILIKNGGDMYISNKEGNNCISLVTHSSSFSLLKKLGYKEQHTKRGMRKNMKLVHPKNIPSKNIEINNHEQRISTNKSKEEISRNHEVKKPLSPDTKRQMAWQEVKSQGYGSMSSLNSSTCSTADDSAGTFNLSFQYNSKNKVFKVRVWEIVLTSLLDTSYLSKDVALHLFVKTTILPNNQYHPIPSLKRKSETILLKPGTHPYTEKNSASIVSWFKREAKIEFRNSLVIEYDNIEKDVTVNSTIQISLCVRLKAGFLSNKNKNQKTPVVAGLYLKLSEAIKTIMKTEYCTERHDLPGITRPSLPLDIVISGETNSAYYSDPSVCCDISSTNDYAVNRSASDGDLQNISVHQYSNSSSFVDLSNQEDIDTSSTLESVDSHSLNINSHVKVNVPHDIGNKLQFVKVNKKLDEDQYNQGNVKIEMKSLNKLQPKHKILLKSNHHHHKLNVNHNKETSLNKEILPTNFVDEEHFLGSPSESCARRIQRKKSNEKPSSSLFTQIDESPSPLRMRKHFTANSPILNRSQNSGIRTDRTSYSTSRLIYDDDTKQNELYSVHNPCFIDDETKFHN